MNVMKYAYSMIGLLCIWIFAVLVIDSNDLLDLPMFAYAAVLAVMIAGGHVPATRRYGNPGADEADGKTMLKVFVATILGVGGTVAAALALTALINPDYRAELSAPFVTCSRDDSQIKTENVDKELAVDGGTILVHSITMNVPQSSKNPQPYSYECQKATLVELSVTSSMGTDETLNIRDLELVTTERKNGITADELRTGSEFASYAESNKLNALRQSRLNDSHSERGWIAFPMSESDTGDALNLIFDSYGQNKSVDLT